jgi:tagatose-1,6-bisphosphate aldolase
MNTLSLGKMRGLQQCATKHGSLAILALDHRNNLQKALNPTSPESVTYDEMVSFKNQVVTSLGSTASAILLDPEVGAAQCISAGVLPGTIGLITALEATSYTGDSYDRRSNILSGWSVGKAKRMGSSAIKLLVYYHPDASSASYIEDLVHQVAQDCRDQDIPLFLEPLSYSPDPNQKKLHSEEIRRVVLETARRLTIPGVDILKAEFPLDIKTEPDEKRWAEACAELTSVSRVPWVLLSASVNFETYLRQVIIACEQGASGVAVGRAVWQEAVNLSGHDRVRFLDQVAHLRMVRISDLCDTLAKPWTDFYTALPVEQNWYLKYA